MISAAELRPDTVGTAPNTTKPSSAAHTRPVYSTGAARLASMWENAQVVHSRPPVASAPINSRRGGSLAAIGCHSQAIGTASTSTGNRCCTSRMVRSASCWTWRRASTTTPA